MTEAESRAAVVAEARAWLGTPWRHRGRVKGVGVDCGQLPLAVFAACGLLPRVDPGPYARDWHLHQRFEMYLEIVRRFAVEIAEAEALPGDFLAVRYGRVFSHGVIVIDWPRGVHASAPAGAVVLCDVIQEMGGRARKAFRLKEWADGR